MDVNFSLIIPELFVAGLGFLVMIISLLVPKDQKKGLAYLTIFGLFASLVIIYSMIDVQDSLFNGMYVVDPFGSFLKILIVVSSMITVLLGINYVEKFITGFIAEFCFLIIFATLGMMALVSAGDFITL